MEAPVYTQQGEKRGTVELPEAVFGVKWNGDLVHQVVVGMQANARERVAHTKDRSDVSGGGKKPWMQKGTGRARHGSSRSPIWRGGGVTFGPRNDKDYTQKINRKMRAKALCTVLSRKFRDGELIFVDTLAFDEPKTAKAKDVLAHIQTAAELGETLLSKKRNAALIALSEYDAAVAQSFRNFGNVAVSELRNVNAVDVLTYRYVIIVNPDAAVELFGQKQPAAQKA
jgi:large subunit ribosomal protein L4